MSVNYDTAYLDWDGVLWDFKQAFCDWFSAGDVFENDKWEFYESLGMDEAMFKGCLSGLPQEFWEQEKYITPHAADLVRWARANADRVFILTVAPERTTAQGKQNLARKYFDLGIYTVACADQKVEFANRGCLLIDDKASTVIEFHRTHPRACGHVWPTDYNQGLDAAWYFSKSWLHEHKKHWALTDSDRADILKDMKPKADRKYEKAFKRTDTFYTTSTEEKPKLDYDAMDEAKRRKMTPMYSGLLAYFADALALVAQNSMVGHYQHNDPNEPMYWDRSKSADEMDAMIRHMADHSKDPYDSDGRLHMSKVAWRALAFLQKFIEEENKDGV